ncbi:hypothetical protein [Kitasatospora sp. NPDC098663]|uniref:hypothetical protein n=1 Tax=Kitasatospora sp. NPDC098663 TaxID=3364096 RepID=UPI00381200F2
MYSYRCGVCRTVSDHLDPTEALIEQRRHITAVHDGRAPEQQSITPLDTGPGPTTWTPDAASWETSNQRVLRTVVAIITRSKLSLTVTTVVVAFICWRVYDVFSHLADALPAPSPYMPGTTHTPPPLPTGQPLASVIASANAAPPTPH